MMFSGWRDPRLTPKGFMQAQEVAEQLRDEKINYAFTSHLSRARKTLEIVLEAHPNVSVFIDDRLIERCYGLLQGKSKRRIARERPEYFAQVHRGYDFPPPEGESLRMVENRTLPFLNYLKEWLRQNPGNVAISCHGNSMRPIRRVFENLSLKQMLQIENPQDKAIAYALHCHEVCLEGAGIQTHRFRWRSVRVPKQIRLATDTQNPLKKYY